MRSKTSHLGLLKNYKEFSQMPIMSTYTKDQPVYRMNEWKYHMKSSRQKRPYVSANFTSTRVFVTPDRTGLRFSGTSQQAWNSCVDAASQPHALTAREIAYTRLMKKALPQAALLVNAAQGKQAWEMIAQRSIQLVKAFNYLRKGNLARFAATLFLDPATVKKRTTRKAAIQNPAGAWLEFTFGWSPLVGDVYTSIDILQREFPMETCRGSGRKLTDVYTSFLPERDQSLMVVATASVRADMVITNPNLLLANQLGLLNPAAVVWDIIPFSFVVDWFLPVGKFIKQFNDQAGIKFINQCTTVKITSDSVWKVGHRPPPGYNKWVYDVERSSARSVQRVVAPLIKPGFPTKVTLPTGSMWLAATSVALLIQVFGRK